MRSFFATLRQLVLPAGAPAGTPRTIIGADLPPPLDTYLFNGIIKASGGIIMQGSDPTTYQFLAFVPGTNAFNVVMGSVLLGSVQEFSAGVPLGQSWSVNAVGTVVQGFFTPSNSPLTIVGGTSILTIPGSDIKIDAVSQARGIVGMASSVGNSAAVGVETVYLSPSATFKNGRCYRLTLNYHCRGAAGATSCIMRIRRINLAGGAYINDLSFPFQAAFTNDSSGTFVRYIRNTTGADITQVLAWTWQPDAGTAQMIGAGGIVGAFVIEDCGAAADFPNVNTVV